MLASEPPAFGYVRRKVLYWSRRNEPLETILGLMAMKTQYFSLTFVDLVAPRCQLDPPSGAVAYRRALSVDHRSTSGCPPEN